jgi:hypothetical protein
MFAIQKFTGTGVICAPFYPAQTCAGFVQSVGPGTKTCAATVKAVICPAGQYVSSFDGAGNPTCSTYLKPNQSCAAGYGAYAVDSSGTLLCQRLTRKLTCGGSHTYYDCTSAGGYVVNYGSATNSNCHFNGGTCPGGWSQCPTYAATNSASCQDSDSNCSYSAKTTKTANASAFNSPVSPYTVQCGYWARNSGPWVRSCTYYATSGPTATNSRTEIGCY